MENAVLDEFSKDKLVPFRLDDQGIMIDEVCQHLLEEGVEKFIESLPAIHTECCIKMGNHKMKRT